MIHVSDSSAFKLYLAIMLQEIGGILQPPLLKLSIQLLIGSIFQVIIASHTRKQLLHIQRINQTKCVRSEQQLQLLDSILIQALNHISIFRPHPDQ